MTGTGSVSDTTQYLDQATAVAQPACKAPDGYKFECWVLQRWDGSAYVDVATNPNVYPGGEFTIEYNDAKQDVIERDENDQIIKANYTIQLRAKFVKVDDPVPTHIDWYSNLQDVTGASLVLNKFIHDGINDSNATKGWYVTDKPDGDLMINEGVDIRSATTYSYPGYAFVGWAKSADADGSDGSLFLKWDADNNQFLAKDANGAWVKVTQVAADENRPYDDLYAVWKAQYFYVYHSSDATVRQYNMPSDDNGFDIVALTAKNFLYGGYYSDYAKKGDYDLNNPVEGNFGEAYTGDQTSWKSENVYTAPGKTMQPEAGKTYFLKEVPNTYLMPTQIETFHRFDLHLRNLILTSVVDDANYSAAGFTVGGAKKAGEFVPSFTITFGANSEHAGEEIKEVTFNAQSPEISGGLSGLVLYFGLFDIAKDSYNALIGADPSKGVTNVVKPYWVTPDGVTVSGSGLRRIITKDVNTDSIIQVDGKEVTYRNAKASITAVVA